MAIGRVNIFPRKCEACGQGMSEGYFLAGTVLCSDKCTFVDGYTREQFEKDVAEDGDIFWTEWDEFDGGEAYTKDGKPATIPPCPVCGTDSASEQILDTFECGSCYRKRTVKKFLGVDPLESSP